MVGLCPLEVAARETAVLLQSDWLGGKFDTSQSLSGNLAFFFFIYVFIFGCLQKEVQSHLIAV